MQIPLRVLNWRPTVHNILLRDPDISDKLLLAMIWQESGGDQFAFRYEPGYQYFCDLHGTPLYSSEKSVIMNRFDAQEKLGLSEFHMQSGSHGLLQVMGAVARENMLEGGIAQLYLPQINIEHSVRVLHKHMRRFGDIRMAVMRYNGAGVAAMVYRDEVFAKLAALERLG